MKSKNLVFLLVLIIFFSFNAAGQNVFSIDGKVADISGRSLNGASIFLSSNIDSSMIQSSITDNNGIYRLKGLKIGSYKIAVTMLGYTSNFKAFRIDSTSLTLGTILLEPSVSSLKEIKITVVKPLVEQKIDRTVINVSSLLSTAGSTALEALEKSPGITTDQNGTFNLRGKAATIFIDDKPIYLSGSDLENYLRSLPSSALDQIELMTNPPARYDAAGNGGVINIRTKKTKAVGLNGGLNLGYIQGRFARFNNGGNINYRNNKVNLSENISYITTNSYGDLNINRRFLDMLGETSSLFLQNSSTRYTGQSLTSRLGLDYYITKRTTFGLGITGIYRPNNQTAVVNSQFLSPNSQLDSTILANNKQKGSFKNGAVNLNFRHRYDTPGRSLTADLDYLNYSTGRKQDFLNNSYLDNGIFKNKEVLSGDLPTGINIYSAKVDYDQPLKNGLKLSFGLKSNFTSTDNEANYFLTMDNIKTPDYSKTNHFTYKEYINAAYISMNKEYKHLTMQGGLRVESARSTGHQLGNLEKQDSTFNKKKISLFPTLYLQYRLDTLGNNTIGVNYGRRIDRPYYQDLNPFISPIDKFTYYTGNPFLKPSYTNSIELSHTYKNKLTTTLTYSKTLDQVNETIEILNGIYYSRPGNIGKSVFKSISINGNLDPTSWLRIGLYGQFSNIHAQGSFYTGYLDTRGSFFYIKPLMQFSLKKDWVIQLDGYYQSKITNVQFIAGEQKRLNAAISKKISPNASLKLVVNDIFHSYVNSGTINNLLMTHADYRNVLDTRTAILTFNYSFGKAIAGQRNHNENSADPEKERVKN